MQCPPHATTDRIYPDASKPVQSPQIIVEFCFLCSALFTRSLIFISKLESTTYHVIFFCVSKYICIGFSVIFCQILVSDLYVGFSVIFVKSSFVLRVCGFCGEADCFHPQLIDAHSKLVFLMYKYTTNTNVNTMELKICSWLFSSATYPCTVCIAHSKIVLQNTQPPLIKYIECVCCVIQIEVQRYKYYTNTNANTIQI